MGEETITYGRSKTVAAGFDEVKERVVAALKERGFGVLCEIPVSDKIKGALDIDMRRYLILGACNPRLANKAIEAEPEIGLLLPCNVLLQQLDDGVKVSVVDAQRMLDTVGNAAMKPIAAEADTLLTQALAAV